MDRHPHAAHADTRLSRAYRKMSAKYAGRLVTSLTDIDPVLFEKADREAAEKGERLARVTLDGTEYTISSPDPTEGREPYKGRYLIPYYTSTETDRSRREEQFFKRQIARFFEAAQEHIGVERDLSDIVAELKDYNHLAKKVYTANPDFTLSTPYRLMSDDEKRLTRRGAQFTGRLVHRMGRLGEIVINGNDGILPPKERDDYIRNYERTFGKPRNDLRSLDEAQKDDLLHHYVSEEFNYWSNLLLFGQNLHNNDIKVAENLIRSVPTRYNRPDHDGILGYFIYDIVKILAADIRIDMKEHDPKAPELTEAEKERMHSVIERESREGVVRNIGLALHSIDQTYLAARDIARSAEFRRLFTSDEVRVRFDHLLYDYAEICRKRATIPTKDKVNYNPVVEELKYIEGEINITLGDLREVVRHDVDRDRAAFDHRAINLIDRSVKLMTEQGELRLPRNRTAAKVYDKGKEGFPKDPSSVGRLSARVERWLDEAALLGTPEPKVIDITTAQRLRREPRGRAIGGDIASDGVSGD